MEPWQLVPDDRCRATRAIRLRTRTTPFRCRRQPRSCAPSHLRPRPHCSPATLAKAARCRRDPCRSRAPLCGITSPPVRHWSRASPALFIPQFSPVSSVPSTGQPSRARLPKVTRYIQIRNYRAGGSRKNEKISIVAGRSLATRAGDSKPLNTVRNHHELRRSEQPQERHESQLPQLPTIRSSDGTFRTVRKLRHWTTDNDVASRPSRVPTIAA